MDGGHPQVGGARVEHHGEGLRRRSQADLTVILGLFNPENRKEKIWSQTETNSLFSLMKLSDLTLELNCVIFFFFFLGENCSRLRAAVPKC